MSAVLSFLISAGIIAFGLWTLAYSNEAGSSVGFTLMGILTVAIGSISFTMQVGKPSSRRTLLHSADPSVAEHRPFVSDWSAARLIGRLRRRRMRAMIRHSAALQGCPSLSAFASRGVISGTGMIMHARNRAEPIRGKHRAHHLEHSRHIGQSQFKV